MKKSVITKAQFPFRQISSFVILSFSIYFFISLITYDQNDPSFSSIYSENQIITNAGGFFGAYMSDLFLLWIIKKPFLFLLSNISAKYCVFPL